MKKTPDFHGLLVLDKPGGVTSRAALDRAAHWFPRGTRIGHTGTLDPLATGVLVLCLGMATRLAEYVQRMGKTYRTRLRLGTRSDTDDADGAITAVAGARAPEAETVTASVAGLVGEIEQVPPEYSAAKVSGRRAYDLARRGQEVALAARRVHVYGIDVLNYVYPRLELEIRCGKGTYVRSLARDLGERLGCGALVETLRRTRVGPFTVEQAVLLDAEAEVARGHVLPASAAVSDLPRVTLADADLARLRRGLDVPFPKGFEAAGEEAAVFDGSGRLAAVVAMERARGRFRPIKVLPE
jgi:tRNA pseudouridine55 synthase